MRVDMIETTEATAKQALSEVATYFSTPVDEGKPIDAERIDRGIKMLGIYSRLRATRANELGIAVIIARMANLSGEALGPIWEALTGRALPPARERSGDAPRLGAARGRKTGAKAKKAGA